METLELEPYLSTLIPPWPNNDVTKPGEKTVIAVDVEKTTFNHMLK